jgi:hypothetical protein
MYKARGKQQQGMRSTSGTDSFSSCSLVFFLCLWCSFLLALVMLSFCCCFSRDSFFLSGFCSHLPPSLSITLRFPFRLSHAGFSLEGEVLGFSLMILMIFRGPGFRFDSFDYFKPALSM